MFKHIVKMDYSRWTSSLYTFCGALGDASKIRCPRSPAYECITKGIGRAYRRPFMLLEIQTPEASWDLESIFKQLEEERN